MKGVTEEVHVAGESVGSIGGDHGVGAATQPGGGDEHRASRASAGTSFMVVAAVGGNEAGNRALEAVPYAYLAYRTARQGVDEYAGAGAPEELHVAREASAACPQHHTDVRASGNARPETFDRDDACLAKGVHPSEPGTRVR